MGAIALAWLGARFTVYLADNLGLGARACPGANVAVKATHTGTTTEKN